MGLGTEVGGSFDRVEDDGDSDCAYALVVTAASDAHIRPVTAADLPDIRAMMREYQDWLGIDLSFQHFAEELASLPGDYGPPEGALFIASVDDRPVGMVALRRLSDDRCEMKRLFVRPMARGSGLGARLIDVVILEARQRGYREMVLDTLPVMTGAQRLYERAGFEEVAPYYDSPVPGTRFMARSLHASPRASR